MPVPTRRRFINVTNFKHGTTDYNTIRSVSYNDSAQRITESGDGDKFITAQFEGVADADITITLTDPIQAQALRTAVAASVTFQGEPEVGGTGKLVTITNFKVFARSGNDGHASVGVITLRGNGRSADGTTPIVTEALLP